MRAGFRLLVADAGGRLGVGLPAAGRAQQEAPALGERSHAAGYGPLGLARAAGPHEVQRHRVFVVPVLLTRGTTDARSQRGLQRAEEVGAVAAVRLELRDDAALEAAHPLDLGQPRATAHDHARAAVLVDGLGARIPHEVADVLREVRQLAPRAFVGHELDGGDAVPGRRGAGDRVLDGLLEALLRVLDLGLDHRHGLLALLVVTVLVHGAGLHAGAVLRDGAHLVPVDVGGFLSDPAGEAAVLLQLVGAVVVVVLAVEQEGDLLLHGCVDGSPVGFVLADVLDGLDVAFVHARGLPSALWFPGWRCDGCGAAPQ